MGLFSKLFSREGEEPTDANDQDGRAASGAGEAAVTKREESVAGSAPSDARVAIGRAGSSEATVQPVSSDKHAKRSPETASAQHPPSSTKKAPALEPPLPAADKTVRKDAKPAAPLKPPAAAATAARPIATSGTIKTEPIKAEPIKTEAGKNALGRTQIGLGRKPTEPGLHGEFVGALKSPPPVPPDGTNRGAIAPALLPLEAAVDAAVAALQDPRPAQPATQPSRDHENDQRAVAETFAEMAKIHAAPLRELMFQLSLGRTPQQWAATCRPVLRPLFDAATQIGLLELVGALGAFDAALERAANDPSPIIGEPSREALAAAYERLRRQLPEAFSQSERSESRKLILLESLLLQIPSFHRRTLSKLYGAGLSSLGQLCQATPDELSAVAGIDRELARAVVETTQRFERERNRIEPPALRLHLHERLRAILLRLTRLQTEFEQAEEVDSAARKREARRGREAAVLELDLLFAELGDIEVIDELKHVPVRHKIRRVESYLEQLQATA